MMGKTTSNVAFCDVDLKIDVHSATRVEDLRPITLDEFANGQEANVVQIEETGEFVFTRVNGDFVTGPEV